MPILGSGSSVRAGTIQAWPSTTVPAGWLKCNGATVSRTLYAGLFNVIGTTYGAGDGSTTFGLPDFRGEFIRGLDDGRGIDTSRALGSAQAEATKDHTHWRLASQGVEVFANTSVGGGNTLAGGPYAAQTANATGGMSAAAGSETRPRNQAALYIIKF